MGLLNEFFLAKRSEAHHFRDGMGDQALVGFEHRRVSSDDIETLGNVLTACGFGVVPKATDLVQDYGVGDGPWLERLLPEMVDALAKGRSPEDVAWVSFEWSDVAEKGKKWKVDKTWKKRHAKKWKDYTNDFIVELTELARRAQSVRRQDDDLLMWTCL
jgi:hypothetical protein